MSSSLAIDHIVVSAKTLREGVAYVEDSLSVKMAAGGKHAAMSTHNALLNLGDAYLEVIAIDSEAPDPGRARWFDLDNFNGPPRLTNWVAQTEHLADAIALAPDGVGEPMELSRGDLRWKIAISEDGTLPFDGAFPGLIDWEGAPHPTTRLPKPECRLEVLQVGHPDSANLHAALSAFSGGLQNCVADSATFGFRAAINTSAGLKVLS